MTTSHDDFGKYYLQAKLPNLEEILKEVKKVEEEVVVFYAAQMVMAIGYLHHSEGIVHRSINLKNLLLAEDGYLRLSGFEKSAKIGKGRMMSEKFGAV